MSELLKYAIIVLIPFAVQLVILFATGKRFQFLRFAIPILTGAADMIFFLLCCLDTPPNGLSVLVLSLAVVLCFTLAGLILIGWGLAWALYYLVKFVIS